MRSKGRGGGTYGSLARRAAALPIEGGLIRGTYQGLLTCRNRDGSIRFQERLDWHNLITNVGLNYVLDAALGAGTQVTAWHLMLKGAGAPAAGDTMAAHAGWAEVTAYAEATRQAWTRNGAASGQSITNSAAPAVFTINADGTVIAGAALTSSNTKGGTTGTLYSVGNFGASKTVDSGDTLEITGTFTQADDGV